MRYPTRKLTTATLVALSCVPGAFFSHCGHGEPGPGFGLRWLEKTNGLSGRTPNLLDALRALWAALVAIGHLLAWLLTLLSW